MTALETLLAALVLDLPQTAGGAADGGAIAVTGVELDVPVEARIGPGGVLYATLPRGRLATGFSIPHGRLGVRVDARRA